MVIFSCAAFAANRTANHFISDRGDIVSATGAFVIGLCGNLYSRIVGGTAFTSMVTGVLFLVPVSVVALSDSRTAALVLTLSLLGGSRLRSVTAVGSSRTTTAQPSGTLAVSSSGSA